MRIFSEDGDPISRNKALNQISNNLFSETTKLQTDASESKVSGDIKNSEVIIHVVDPISNNKRDFMLNQKILMSRMKFFEKYTSQYMATKQFKNQSDKPENQFALLDELDITVQWQIDVFKWLLKYITGPELPLLDVKNVSSILVSADSLIMKDLVQEWLSFITNNLADIVKVNESTPPYKSHLAKELAKMISIDTLDSLGDKKSYLLSRLYKKKLEMFFENPDNLLCRWVECNDLFTQKQAEIIPCQKVSDIFINYKGEVIPQHNLDYSFDLNEYVMILREKKLQWKTIYWKLWATTVMFSCTIWEKQFRAIDFDKCMYHPEEVVYYFGSVQGRYYWWSQLCHKFNSDWVFRTTGCKAREHQIDINHPSLSKKQLVRFKRNVNFIIDIESDKIRYDMIIGEAIKAWVKGTENEKEEDTNDWIDIDSIFTSNRSTYLQIKDNKISVPQIQIKKENIVTKQVKNTKLDLDQEGKVYKD